MLRSRRTRREQPLDGLRPEPIIDDPAIGTDPEHEALLADAVGIALQVVLDTLDPAERLAFVLHDMFAVPFDEIAGMVDRSPQATRQLAIRARRRVREAAPAPDPQDATARRSCLRQAATLLCQAPHQRGCLALQGKERARMGFFSKRGNAPTVASATSTVSQVTTPLLPADVVARMAEYGRASWNLEYEIFRSWSV